MEDWTRISIFLPAGSSNEKLALQKVIEEIKKTHDGITYSQLDSTVFLGFWRNDKGTWERDDIVWVLIDTPFGMEDLRLKNTIEIIGLSALFYYQENKAKQSEVWVMAHEISKSVYKVPE